MKILCVSDFVDPLIYNQNVKEIFPDIDAILCAGDLPMDYIDFIVTVFNKPTYFVFGNHNLKEYSLYHKSAQDLPGQQANKYAQIANGHGATYLGFKTHVSRSLYYTDKNGKKTPLLLAGASGCNKYNNGLCQFTNNQMKFKLLLLAPALIKNKIKYGRYLDIFLTHATPRHVHDHDDPCHKGFECFNWFIKKFEPLYLIHGHIHLYDMREKRISKVENTTVVNAYSHSIIELPINDLQIN